MFPLQTRSGGEYSSRAALHGNDGEEDLDRGLARGRLRNEKSFRNSSRGQYASLAALRNSHKQLFSQDSVFVQSGEMKKVRVFFPAFFQHPPPSHRTSSRGLLSSYRSRSVTFASSSTDHGQEAEPVARLQKNETNISHSTNVRNDYG